MENTSSNSKALLPVYLIAGEDELKKERVLDRLHKRLEKMGDLSFNSEFFSGETATGEEIVIACNTLPFASDVRLVQVDKFERLKKADTEAIISYLKEPCSTTVLALVATTVAKNSRIYKAVIKFGKTAFISCAPFARKDLNSAVRSMALNHGVAFTEGASASIIDLVGTNTVALDSNIKKVALAHRGSDPVNEGEVYALVSRTSTIKSWDFVNAFSARNLERSFLLLRRVEDGSPYRLLSMCVTRIRELITIKALEQRGESARLPEVLKIPEWRVRNLRSYARNYTSKELITALRLARDADQSMKSGKDADTVFLEWLIAVEKK